MHAMFQYSESVQHHTTLKKLRSILKAPKRFIRQIQLTRELSDCRFVLTLGHMRSGSSLLIHLMANHPEISAFGESQIKYRSLTDLKTLRSRCQAIHAEKAAVWYLDKVLHDYYIDDPILIQKLFSRIVLTYRDPNSTLASMVHTKTQFNGNESLETYRNYYCQRLQSLAIQLKMLAPNTVCAVHYETLTSEPEPELQRIQHLLELKSPLSTTYELMETSGKRGLGDPSKTILEKRILIRERGPLEGEFTDQRCIDAFLTFEDKLREFKILT